jgi:2-hydroxychromene-2-carboxylate isomerase
MSSIDPLHSDKPLIIYLDIKSPYAFVAIRPTLELIGRLGIGVDWRPLTLDIPSYLGSAKKSAGKVVQSSRSASQWSAVKYAYRDASRYAERQGYQLHGTEKIWDSSLPNMGISWVNSRQPQCMGDYLHAVYPAFWRRELDIEDLDTVIRCLASAGVDSEGFAAYASGEGRRQHDALQNHVLDAGIYGVPTYVFADHILFGRENLPYVEWCLGGRKGRAPRRRGVPGMTPTIYIDFRNPASYLAMQPTCALLERLQLEARWLPFRTSEETIPAAGDEETRGKQHRRVRALARRRTHLLYANVQNVEMRFRDLPGSSDCSLAALALLEDEPLPFMRAAFRAYWTSDANLDDEATVRVLWQQTMPARELDLAAGRERLEVIRQGALEQKVFHAPTYLVGDQLFLGREHLPWVEALLSATI